MARLPSESSSIYSDQQLQNLLPKSGHRQLNRQVGGLIMLVDYRIYFNDRKARHAAVVGDDLHSEMSLAIGSSAAHRRPDARRVFRIDPVHIERHVITRCAASGGAQRLFHDRTHAALVDVA